MARQRVVELTADATLSKNQSGSLIILNSATGLIAKLPTGSRGLQYDFYVRTEATLGTYTIDAGSNSMTGIIVITPSSGTYEAPVFYSNDLTARVASMSASGGGGLVGGTFSIVCDEDGVWNLTGTVAASGASTSPFGAA